MLYSPSHWFLRHRLKLRALTLLVAMDDHASLQRAADTLGMTQPAASKMLAELEQMLGLTLFQRFPRGVEATPFGAGVIRRARHVLSELNLVWDEASASRADAAHQIAIGSIKAPALSMVPRAIAAFQTQFPKSRVNLMVDSSPELMLKLKRDELDIVVGRLSHDLQAQAFAYEPLVDEQPAHVVARPSHPWHQRQAVHWDELAQAQWIVPPQGSLMRLKFESLFVQQKIMLPQRLVETQDLDIIRRLINQTDMVAVLTDEVATACECVQVPCVSELLPLQMQGFGLITKQGRPLSNSVQAMKKILKTMAQAQYDTRHGSQLQARPTKKPA